MGAQPTPVNVLMMSIGLSENICFIIRETTSRTHLKLYTHVHIDYTFQEVVFWELIEC